MSTSFSVKIDVLAEVHAEAMWNEKLDEFKEYNNAGLPIAYLAHQDLVEVKDAGKVYIEETWKLLCESLGIDPNKEYKNSDELLNSSPLLNEDKEEDK